MIIPLVPEAKSWSLCCDWQISWLRNCVYTTNIWSLDYCLIKKYSQPLFYRKMDGRPKLFLRRFFSSIGLNSVGRLVKGGRSSSMEQLSIPTAPRANSASPSPTRRPQPTIRIQRTPSLQTLHTVSMPCYFFVLLYDCPCIFFIFVLFNHIK